MPTEEVNELGSSLKTYVRIKENPSLWAQINEKYRVLCILSILSLQHLAKLTLGAGNMKKYVDYRSNIKLLWGSQSKPMLEAFPFILVPSKTVDSLSRDLLRANWPSFSRGLNIVGPLRSDPGGGCVCTCTCARVCRLYGIFLISHSQACSLWLYPFSRWGTSLSETRDSIFTLRLLCSD